MKIEIKDNKVVRTVHVGISAKELYEDVARLTAEADRIRILANQVAVLEKSTSCKGQR